MYPRKEIDQLRAAIEKLEKASRSPERIAADEAVAEEERLSLRIADLVGKGFTGEQAKSILSIEEDPELRFQVLRDVAHHLRLGNYESLSDPFHPTE